jgi:hydrogenase expression/formation protein HypE
VDQPTIQLAHGGGGELTSQLLEEVILPALGISRRLRDLADAASLDVPAGRLAFTTDSYVVQPLEFPGGDIGKLAICGTVNDLAVCGARPLALSLSLVIQEGLEIARLRRLLESAGRAARQAGVEVVTGDTKVVERTACDGLIVNTACVGEVHPAAQLDARRVGEGDVLVLSGPLGEHGLAVMGQRSGLGLSLDLVSDCAPLWPLAAALLEELGSQLKFMRDPTRGGLAATLVELSRSCGRGMEIREADLPANRAAQAAAAILGLDLLSVANEGKLVAAVAPDAADRAVAVLRRFDLGRRAAAIGRVGALSEEAVVELLTRAGGRRLVQMPYGEELPRIC